MQMYFALVHHEKGSAFGLHFPDVPGCFSAADEERDILKEAQTALALHLEDLEELPVARTIEQLTGDKDVQQDLTGGAFFIGVPVVMIEKKSRFNLMLEPSIVSSVDVLAQAAGVSRSEFISDTLEKRLSATTGAVIIDRRRSSLGGSTGGKVASSAGKVLASKTASKAEKTVAASALTQKGSTERTSAKVASAAAKVMKDKGASKDARSAAASALTQKKK